MVAGWIDGVGGEGQGVEALRSRKGIRCALNADCDLSCHHLFYRGR